MHALDPEDLDHHRANMQEAKALAGHSSVWTTEFYNAVSDKDALEAAMKIDIR